MYLIEMRGSRVSDRDAGSRVSDRDAAGLVCLIEVRRVWCI